MTFASASATILAEMRLPLIMLACAATLTVASPGLGRDRAGPVDAVRSCPRYGPGFVEVPGTSTCIRIGGRVRSEYGASSRRVAREDIAGFRNGGQVSVDTRTDTAYGPLRSYVRVRAGQGVDARR